jgi:transposase
MKAYSEDLRRKIVQAVGGGMGKSEVARTLGVSLSSIKRYVGMHTRGGLSLRRSLPACARRSMSKARGSFKRTSKSDRPLPSPKGASSCSAWRECELATRRSPGQ